MDYQSLKNRPFFILGPCVIESAELIDECAAFVKELSDKLDIQVIFKSSFDKANRTSISSFRGPGMETGLTILNDVKQKYQLPILTDIHESYQASPIGTVVDIIQIPAFLCRQTDLLIASAGTGKIINIKKAQFLSSAEMQFPANKVIESGNSQVMLTERGSMYGYNNLVVDYRNMVDMLEMGFPVIFDGTHSVQKPGGLNGKSGGDRKYVPYLAKAAKAIGVNNFFFEIHPNPDKALSDGPNMLDFAAIELLISQLIVN
jgi:2-dehydro-3-deoxyphosphooctonate aldolase (KDO 8-P synthase)